MIIGFTNKLSNLNYQCLSAYLAFRSNFHMQLVQLLSDSAYLNVAGKSGETHIDETISLPPLI
jgi:hypothetical protein